MQGNGDKHKNFKQIVKIFYNEEIDGINNEEETIKKTRKYKNRTKNIL